MQHQTAYDTVTCHLSVYYERDLWKRRRLPLGLALVFGRGQAWRPQRRLQLGRRGNPDKSCWADPSEYTAPKEGLFKIVAIIIKTIIGAHIVLIPYTASILGWALFPVVLIVIIAIHHYTSILLLKCKNICRHSNFSTIMFSIWDHDASKIFGAALMMLNNLAFCTSKLMQVFYSSCW